MIRILSLLAWNALKAIFGGVWDKIVQKRVIENAVEPYKAEAQAMARPSGSDDDVIDRM